MTTTRDSVVAKLWTIWNILLNRMLPPFSNSLVVFSILYYRSRIAVFNKWNPNQNVISGAFPNTGPATLVGFNFLNFFGWQMWLIHGRFHDHFNSHSFYDVTRVRIECDRFKSPEDLIWSCWWVDSESIKSSQWWVCHLMTYKLWKTCRCLNVVNVIHFCYVFFRLVISYTTEKRK